jgi:hypothetical protein
VNEGKSRRRSRELTERDAAALTWIGEQYGARLDVLAVLLGRLAGREPLSVWGVRNQVGRWLDMRLVTADRALGATWVTLTRTGLERAGIGYPVWKVPALRLAHCHAVNAVRLAYEATPQASGRPWVCERDCWAERGHQFKWHVPDGVLRDPEGEATDRQVAVEVELTLKTRKQYRADVVGNLRRGTAVIWYFTPDRVFAQRLEAHVAAAIEAEQSDVKAMVRPLPAVPGVTYMGKGNGHA